MLITLKWPPSVARGRLAAGIGAVALLALGACQSMQPVDTPATVYFQLDAPFSGLSMPVQFWIDGTLVATDTSRVTLPSPRMVSRGFAIGAGAHTLGARVGAPGLVWLDRV